MKRTALFILSILIILSAAAADAQRAKRSKSKRSSTKRTVVVKPKVNTDSIEAAHRAQLRLDSLNALTAKVEHGDISAINELGLWYYDGHIVSQDYSRAFALWRQAADSADVRAIAYLGRCYRLGRGVPRDSVEAVNLYTRSIREGNGSLFKHFIDQSQTDLFSAMLIGECYAKGDGVKRDAHRAAEYFDRAAAMGSITGMEQAGLCYLQVSDTTAAFRCFESGASLGNVVCRYWTGQILLDEDRDTAYAVGLISSAADQGMPEAINQLGELYAEGRGVTLNPTQAASLYRKAAEMGCGPAMLNYAMALSTGEGVEINLYEALRWLDRAIDLDSPIASEASEIKNGEMDADTLFGTYIRGMDYYNKGDLQAATALFKLIDKNKMPEGKIMLAVILADPANPKGNYKKGIKTLEDLAPRYPQAKEYLERLRR